MIGFAVTREGIPVRVRVWPGNAIDQTLVEQVKPISPAGGSAV